ncbi:MAG: LacI family DNA-binding transcriptional regulator [Lacibacter sp.]
MQPEQTKKINIKELARLLSLSTATVSKALKDSYEISEQTKKKVQEAALQYNYTPNPYASSLRKKKSKTIAVVLPEVDDNYFSLAIKGIQTIAEEKGYHLLMYLSHEKLSIEKTIMDACTSGRVDGVLISISKESNTATHLNQLIAEQIPVVFFDRAMDSFEAPKVITNDYESGYEGAKILLNKGCKKPVFLSVSSNLPISNLRAEGFVNALKDSGFKKNADEQVIYCDNSDQENYNSIKKLLKSKKKPDGIVASVEHLAMQVYFACQELGLTIPDDVMVIAFSSLEIAPILNPSLSTITQPAFETGKKAAEMLFANIEKPGKVKSTETVILPTEYFERGSTRK